MHGNPPAVLRTHALNAWQSPTILAHQWGGGGGPPLGGVQWNASKNEVPKNVDVFEVLYHSFGIFVIFETPKILIFL